MAVITSTMTDSRGCRLTPFPCCAHVPLTLTLTERKCWGISWTTMSIALATYHSPRSSCIWGSRTPPSEFLLFSLRAVPRGVRDHRGSFVGIAGSTAFFRCHMLLACTLCILLPLGLCTLHGPTAGLHVVGFSSLHTSWPSGGLHVVGFDSPHVNGFASLHTSWPIGGLHVVGFDSHSGFCPVGLCTLHGLMDGLHVVGFSPLHTSWPIGGLHVVGFDSPYVNGFCLCTLHGPLAGYMLSALTVHPGCLSRGGKGHRKRRQILVFAFGSESSNGAFSLLTLACDTQCFPASPADSSCGSCCILIAFFWQCFMCSAWSRLLVSRRGVADDAAVLVPYHAGVDSTQVAHARLGSLVSYLGLEGHALALLPRRWRRWF